MTSKNLIEAYQDLSEAFSSILVLWWDHSLPSDIAGFPPIADAINQELGVVR